MRPRPGIIPEKLPAGLRISERQSDEVARGQPTSVLVFGEEAVDEIAGRFLETYGGRANFSLNRPHKFPHYVVLTHPEADKGSALEMVCRELDVPMTGVMAMGDSESDLGMIQQTGLGIALNNAPDEVKRAALHIAPANDADGGALAIEKFAL